MQYTVAICHAHEICSANYQYPRYRTHWHEESLNHALACLQLLHAGYMPIVEPLPEIIWPDIAGELLTRIYPVDIALQPAEAGKEGTDYSIDLQQNWDIFCCRDYEWHKDKIYAYLRPGILRAMLETFIAEAKWQASSAAHMDTIHLVETALQQGRFTADMGFENIENGLLDYRIDSGVPIAGTGYAS